ncbi:hypothetical protein [Pseudonocardia spinosispora]|uniref:hypothetical protein n=1 Tax=Pseudonocardia spinosispora TaxID=103441 RepID=UPI000406F8D7|nr:hypothetical protein [Pseudonocardia spinosispora]
MNSELTSYLVLLVAGVTLTALVGVILRRSGQSLLEEVYSAPRAAGITRLVTVGFHLFALGILAIISTIDPPVDGQLQSIVTRLGVILLVLAASYGLTLVVLDRIKESHRRAELDEEFTSAMRARS